MLLAKRKKSIKQIFSQMDNGEDSDLILNDLKDFLEDGGEDLSLNEYKNLRINLLGKKNKKYDSLVNEAIFDGYDSKDAKRISMLFNDYITDQHYKLLLTPKNQRNSVPKIFQSYQKYSGSLTPINRLEMDLKKSESLEDRTSNEAIISGFERSIFASPDRRNPITRLKEANEYSKFINPSRISSYKSNTLEMAANYAKDSSDDCNQGYVSGIANNISSKIKSFIKFRRN